MSHTCDFDVNTQVCIISGCQKSSRDLVKYECYSCGGKFTIHKFEVEALTYKKFYIIGCDSPTCISLTIKWDVDKIKEFAEKVWDDNYLNVQAENPSGLLPCHKCEKYDHLLYQDCCWELKGKSLSRLGCTRCKIYTLELGGEPNSVKEILIYDWNKTCEKGELAKKSTEKLLEETLDELDK